MAFLLFLRVASKFTFQIPHQFTDIQTYICFVLVYAKFLSYFMTYDVMTLNLDIVSDFLATQSDCIQAQIIYFIHG